MVHRGKGCVRNAAPPVILSAKVDRNNHIGVGRDGRDNWQRIEQGAINQNPAIENQGRNDAGNRHRGTDGLIQRAFLEPDFLVGEQIGGHGGKGNGEILNPGIPEHFPDHGKDLLAANGPDRIEGNIQQFQDIKLAQPRDPVLVVLHLAGAEHAANQGSHGAARNGDNIVAALYQDFDGANMGIAPGPATTQRQRDCLARFVAVAPFFRVCRSMGA